MRKTMKKLTQGATRLLVLALGLGLVSTGWAVAPTPTVVWDGDFSSLSKEVDGVTYSIENINLEISNNGSGNIRSSDYSFLQVANSETGYKAPTVTATGGSAPFGSTDGSTVLIFVSNMPVTEGSNRALLTFMDNTTGPYGSATPKNSYVRFGIARAKGSSNGVSYGGNCAGGFISAGSIDVNNAPVNNNAFTDGKQSIALTYKGPQGYFKYYVDGQFKGEFNPGSSFTTPTGICIGGLDYTSSSWFYAQKSMKIHTIAIFDRELTADEIAEYESQSKWRYCEAIAWRNESGDFHQSKYLPVGSVSAAVAGETLRQYNTDGFPWATDLRTDAKYPIAIFYDISGKQQSVGGDFSNLYIGGLNVTATPSSGTIYTLTGKNANGTRETVLGDKTGNHESWFVFDESYTLSRSGAAGTTSSLLYGTVNMQIKDGKTFSFNADATTAASNLVMTAGTQNNAAPCLRMIGGGKFAVKHLNASAGTLDFSGVTATPFIQGLVTVGDSTVFKFPAGAVFPYAVATSVNSSMSGNVTFWVGNTSYSDRTLTFTDGAVYPSGESSATFAGGNSGTWAGLDWDINYAGAPGHNITVTADGAINLGSASATKVTFDVPDGVTLTLTGTLTASEIYINGNGVVQVSAANTLQGTIKGNGTVKYANNVRPTTTGVDVVFTNLAWTGTVWLYDYAYTTSLSGGNLGLYPHYWSNSGSKLKFTKVKGYLPGRGNSSVSFAWQLGYEGQTVGELILEDEGDAAAFERVDGFSHSAGDGNSYCRFAGLSGSGTLKDSKDQYIYMVFDRADGFAGTINVSKGTTVIIGAVSPTDANWDGKIVVASGADAAVASGKTWTSKNGVVVNGTLTLNASTSTLSGTVTGSGKIVCDEFVPSLTGLTAAGWTGTVSIAANEVSGTEWTTESIMNSGSTVEITEGMLKVADVSKLTGSFRLATGTYLRLTDSTSTSASIKISDFSGNLYVQKPNAFTSVQVELGTLRSIGGSVTLSSQTLPVELTLSEVKGEGGIIDASGLTAFTGRTLASNTYKVRRVDGVTVDATLDKGTLNYTPAISGAAADIDWDFTDGTDNSLEQAPSGVTKNQDSTLTFYVHPEDSTYTGVYLKHHPYVDGAGTFIHDNSSAITVAAVGTMPSGSKTIFMNFGSAYDNKYGLLLANSTNANEVLVAYNYGPTVTPITYMMVPNAATARHSYIITKEDGESSTTFTVYLDGIKWKTVTTDFKIEFSSANTGIQFGSDYGGNIRTGGYPAVDENSGTGVLNVLRVYGRVVTPAEIAAYASIFPYVSPNGSASRTFATAAENWIDTTEASEVWNNSGAADSGTPTAGASLNLTSTADTTITVNLASETQYEALTVNGSSVKFQPSSGMIKVSGMTVIGATVTNVYGAVDMSGGPMTLTQDGDITFDYSAYDASGIYTTTDSTTDIPLTSDVDRNDAKVHLIAPATPYRTYSLVYESGHYAMRVTPDHEAGSEVYFGNGYLDGAMTGSGGTGTVYLETDHTHQTALFPGDTMVIDNNSSLYEDQVWVSDAFIGNIKITSTTPMTLHNGALTNPILVGKTIAVESGASLTISKHTSNALTLGALTINGAGAVSLSGPLTLGGAVAGTATVTVDGSVSVASGGSIANTVSGSGTITYAALPAAVPAGFTSWTGTVVLPTVTSGAAPLNLNSYGAVGSTVEVSGVSGSAYLANAAVTPTVHLVGDMTLSAFSATFANTINKLSGSSAFSLTADGSTQGYQNGYFLIKDVSDFTGSITVAAPGLALGGTSKPSSTEWYSNIVVQASVTVGPGATWTADGVVLANTSATLTVPDGATVPEVASGVTGYKVVSDTTSTPGSTVYSLVQKSAAISGVEFEYGEDYESARVTANVSGDATTATLSYGGNNYNASVVNGVATFENVVVTRGSDIYAPIDYEIETDATTTTGGEGSAVVGKTTPWFSSRVSNDAVSNEGGSWDNAPAATDGRLVFDGVESAKFTPTNASSNDVVTIVLDDVVFTGANSDTIGATSQAAVKIAEAQGGGYEFQVLTSSSPETWTSATCQGVTISDSDSYDVVITLNYAAENPFYTVTVDGTPLVVEINSIATTHIPNAGSGSSGVNGLEFKGAGSMATMSGTQTDGNMVVDGAGKKFATVAAAVEALDDGTATEPLRLLHDGTAPDGWAIENNQLVRTAAARIGDVYYQTLQAALDVGGEVVVLQNVQQALALEVASGKTVYLDLNGKTVTRTASGWAIENSGTLLLTNGTIVASAGIATNALPEAQLTVAGGRYSAEIPAEFIPAGRACINLGDDSVAPYAIQAIGAVVDTVVDAVVAVNVLPSSAPALEETLTGWITNGVVSASALKENPDYTLNAPRSEGNGLTLLQSYLFDLDPADEDDTVKATAVTNGDKVEVVGNVVKIKVDVPEVRESAGYTATYKVYNCATGEYVSGYEFSSAAAVRIPADSGRYRVDAVIDKE